MKHIIFLSLLFGFIYLQSCEDDSNNDPTLTSSEVNSTLENGEWEITYYYDSDHEETSDYNNYKFMFLEDGELIATNEQESISGVWSTSEDDSTMKLIIAFPETNILEELNDDWHILEKTDIKIRLQDISGGNGDTDYLTFEKI